jgi:hypothetical protein
MDQASAEKKLFIYNCIAGVAEFVFKKQTRSFGVRLFVFSGFC